MSSFAVLLAAAGKSSRFNDNHYKKPFIPLAQKAVWLHSAEVFLKRKDVKQLIVVVSPEDYDSFREDFGPNLAIHGIEVVQGGDQRADSVQNGLAKVREDVDFVAIHDAARPCISELWIESVFDSATRSGAAILAVPVTSTLKKSADGKSVEKTVPRDGLWQAQTPQVFNKQLLLDCFENRGDQQPTDEAQLVESCGHKVSLVQGSHLNIKITTKSDLTFANVALKALPKPKLDGPIHPFADGNPFV